MKTKLLPGLILSLTIATARAQGTAFTYQGRLNDGAAPAGGIYDLRFTIYDSGGGPTVVAGPLTNSATAVSNGLFAATLDFGPGIFTGPARWLEIAVRTNGAGAFTPLNPRQPLTPSPYAVYSANSTVAGSANGVAPGSVTSSGIAAGTITAANIGSGQVIKSLNGLTDNVTLSPGPGIGMFTIGNGLLISSAAWYQNGNTGTNPTNNNFVGTLDFQPLELRVNNVRGFRLEPTAADGFHSNIVNVVNGSPANFVVPPVYGATIAGGGAANYFGQYVPNSIAADFGSIGGGYDNAILNGGLASVIAGGYINTNNGNSASIGGGYDNAIQTGAAYAVIGGGGFNVIRSNAYQSTIAGGYAGFIASPFGTVGGGGYNGIGTNSNSGTVSGGFDNVIADNSFDGAIGGGSFQFIGANVSYGTIAGGRQNTISSNASSATIAGGQANFVGGNAFAATVGGGLNNTASGQYSTVPGGFANQATASFSLAAGQQARAQHAGAFVWADSQNAQFSSTTSDQFAVRARNGVMVQSTNTALDLRGGGAIRVAGAGLGASTPVFIHRSVSTNTGGNVTTIDHPLCNGDPNAVLLVTQNWNPGGGFSPPNTVYNPHPVGVYYYGSGWAIFNEDSANMPTNAAFNVLVFKP